MADTERNFGRKAGIATAIVATAAVILVLLWNLLDALLLVFAAILLACLVRGAADFLADKTRLPNGWSLAVVVVALAIGLTSVGWFLAPRIAAQTDQLWRSLTSSGQQLTAQISRYELGKRLLEHAPTLEQLTGRGNIVARVTGIFSSTFGLIADGLLVLFIGLYLAICPGVYVQGAVRLLPRARRARMTEVLLEIGVVLQRWLVGRTLLMISNGLLTMLALWLFHIPLALTLGVLAGLLNFVPTIGPLVAAIPAVLIGWTLGPAQALYVLLLYLVLQNLDGYVLTPLVQERTVSLPPALTIVAQLFFGVLAGSLGLLLATPLAAAAVVLVRRLYLEDVLGDQAETT
jgi:predicted PurR-regulated permease PerM